jgi:signal transduction histidine kinase
MAALSPILIPIIVLLAAVAGALGASVSLRRRQRRRDARLAEGLSQTVHDLRGALSPAMLIAERLATHEEPVVRRGAETVLEALERGTTLVKSVAALAAGLEARNRGL